MEPERVPSGGMRTVPPVAGPRRALRAALLLPLLAGVLAMHVLLLCSDGGADHAGHDGAPMAAMPSMSAIAVMPAMPMTDAVAEHVHGAAADVVATATAVLVRDVADADAGSLLGMCLAVVTAGLVLALLGRRSTPATGPRAPRRLHPPGRRAARAPPPAPLLHLLCVSRT